jgi:hypothetical protein
MSTNVDKKLFTVLNFVELWFQILKAVIGTIPNANKLISSVANANVYHYKKILRLMTAWKNCSKKLSP